MTDRTDRIREIMQEYADNQDDTDLLKCVAEIESLFSANSSALDERPALQQKCPEGFQPVGKCPHIRLPVQSLPGVTRQSGKGGNTYLGATESEPHCR